jgi:hypothetical protein
MGFFVCPVMTAEAFSQASGLPLGVVEAQLDRRILPVLRLGKRRLVNIEALREAASQAGRTQTFPNLNLGSDRS